MFEEADRDQDGNIGFEEAMDWHKTLMENDARQIEKYHTVWAVFGTDRATLRDFLRQRRQLANLGYDDPEELFNQLNLN